MEDSSSEYGSSNRKEFGKLHPLNDGTKGSKDDWVYMYDPVTKELDTQRRSALREDRQYNLGRVSRSADYIDIWKGEGDRRIGFTYLDDQSERTKSRQRSGLCNDVFVELAYRERFPRQDKRLYVRSWNSDEGSSTRTPLMIASDIIVHISEITTPLQHSVLLFDPVKCRLTPTLREDLKENEAEYMVGRVPTYAVWVRFWTEGILICRIILKYQKGLTKLGKVLGRCNDVHIRMQKGQMVPPPGSRIELQWQ